MADSGRRRESIPVSVGTKAPKQGQAPKRGMTTGLMLAGAVCVLALPSAVLAFSNRFDPQASVSANDNIASTFEARPSADQPMLTSLAMRSLAKGHPFRFTPAGTPTRPDRSVTVAVRVDQETASSITVRGNRAVALRIPPVTAASQVHIAPTAFTLGVSRGYQSFAQVVTPDVRKIDMPDLATFKSRSATSSAASRFSPRIALDDKAPVGRLPRTFQGDGEDHVDLGGAYAVTRNIDVTAGVRYSRERERLQPLTDGKQDNQAVYVGTQFKF